MDSDRGARIEGAAAQAASVKVPRSAFFSIATERVGAHPCVRLHGELDMLHEGDIRDALLELEKDGPAKLIVDLSGLSFIDSTGLRVLLEADARAREGGWELVLAKGAQELPKVFTITMLDKRLTFVDDPSEVD
jgi:anti-sigma B factor antagonist